MPRSPQPYRIKDRPGYWYATVGGVRHRLTRKGGSRTEAWARLRELLAEQEIHGTDGPPTVLWVLVQYRRAMEAAGTMAATTLGQIRRVLREWCRWEGVGELPVSEIKPHHLDGWLAAQGHAGNTRRAYGGKVRRAFRWAVKAGLIPRDPLAGWEGSPQTRRAAPPSHDDLDRFRAAIHADWVRDLFDLLRHTGARPGEIARARVEHVSGDRIVLAEHKTARKTGKARVIYLDATARAIVERLAAGRSSGPLLRTTTGTVPSQTAITMAFRRTSQACGVKVIPYHLRHRFGSDLVLSAGPTLTGRLMGHTRLTTTQTYIHEGDDADLLRAALERHGRDADRTS
jgi:integrase